MKTRETKRRNGFRAMAFLVAALPFGAAFAAAPVAPRDVVIYGSSPAALTAAIEAQRHGRTAVIVCPETRIGGLTTGGLGQTDIGNKSAFGGLARQFYRDVAAWYRDAAHWTRERRADYLPDGQCKGTRGDESMWTFEPSAALAVEGDCAVQDVPYARLADILVREGHVTGGAPTVQK